MNTIPMEQGLLLAAILFVLAGLLYATKRKVWKNLH